MPVSFEFTEPAEARIASLHEKLDELVRESLHKRKVAVPGEDRIEVTAADIDAISASVLDQMVTRFLPLRVPPQFLVKFYAVVGAVISSIGLLLPYLRTIKESDETRFVLLVAGAGTALAGVVSAWALRFVQNSRAQRVRPRIAEEVTYEQLVTALEAYHKLIAQRGSTTSPPPDAGDRQDGMKLEA